MFRYVFRYAYRRALHLSPQVSLLHNRKPVANLFIKNAKAGFSSSTLSSQNSGNEDVLAMQIRKANPDRLFELIESHHTVMNNDHLIHALESLFAFKKEEAIVDSIVDAPFFMRLCKCLERRAQHFQVDDVVTIIKCLSFIGLTSHAPTMQTYLQMIRHQINDLTLKQIFYLEFLLERQKPLPLIEALMIALPLVLENQLDAQMDPNNLPELVRLFEYGINHRISMKSLKKIADNIVDFPDKMDVDLALTMIWSYIKLKKSWDYDLEVFNRSLEVILESIDRIAPSQLVKMMASLRRKHFFCAPLLEAIGKRAVVEKWPLSFVHSLVITLVTVDVVNVPVLERYAQLVAENENEIKMNPRVSIYTIMEAFELASYTPNNVKDVLRVILNCTEKLRALSEHSALFTRFALFFAVHDCFPTPVVERLMSDRFRERVHDGVRKKVSPAVRDERLKDCLLMSQVLETQGIEYDWSDELKLDSMNATKNERLSHSGILKALLGALGGPQYVLSGIFTRSGLFIDHFVVLRPGNYPVAFNEHANKQGIVYVEEIKVPVDSKRLAIIVHRPSDMTSDGEQVHGLARLPVQLLNRKGLQIIEINLPSWEKIPEHDKIPFIMRNIQISKAANSLEN